MGRPGNNHNNHNSNNKRNLLAKLCSRVGIIVIISKHDRLKAIIINVN